MGEHGQEPVLILEFVYTNRRNETITRKIRATAANSNYVRGVDLIKHRYRTFKLECIHDGEVTNLDTGEIIPVKDLTDILPYFDVSLSQNFIYKSKQDNREQICFTGFAKQRRAELEVRANNIGFHVMKDVSQHLAYLVCGENAGPSKKAKAQSIGAEILSEEDFLDWLEI